MVDRETLRQLLIKVLELRREVQKLIDHEVNDQSILDTILETLRGLESMMVVAL